MKENNLEFNSYSYFMSQRKISLGAVMTPIIKRRPTQQKHPDIWLLPISRSATQTRSLRKVFG